MKCIVVKPFLDKFDNNIAYNVGDSLDFDAERVADCVAKGLVEAIEEKKKTTRGKKANA